MAVVCSFICCPSRRVSGGWTVTESGEIKLSQRAEETERQRDRQREKERERDREREMPRGRQQGEVWLLSAVSFAVLQGGFGGMDCDRAFSSHLDSRVEAQKANMAKRELSSTLRNLKVYAKSNLERGEERRRCQTIPYHLRFPFYEPDFGWGKPPWVTSGTEFKNLIVLMDTRDGDGIEVSLNLKEEDLAIFESTKELLECVLNWMLVWLFPIFPHDFRYPIENMKNPTLIL
ncbi:uncharacterized protein LOC125475722 isoform X3 [Pyrus x bretschneideri]|uniref:uncharacterized protein LOC125475722 isoform X3 n=1 Tax=Pyrus x bretschneideri TaxID=225117 RepID=UPI002030538D|nr:uncharacterized protein LOC125475722 isoform X3 [Pyrus x bretschneideri]